MTPFAVPFLLMVCFALTGARRWLLVSLVACFFQASSPIAVYATGRWIGVTPAYLLVPIGCMYWIGFKFRESVSGGKKLPKGIVWVFAFMLIAVMGAVFLPRFLAGKVHVAAPRVGDVSGMLALLRPGAANLIQAVYAVLNALIVYLTAFFVRRNVATGSDVRKALVFGTLVTCAIGYYQVLGGAVGLPWPEALINSNPGVAQDYYQMVGSLHRMSSTFGEPSMLSFQLLAMLGFIGFGSGSLLAVALLMLTLLLTTSSTAYIGMAAMVLLWSAFGREAAPRKLLFVAVVVFALLLAYVADEIFLRGLVVRSVLVEKLSSDSGITREALNRVAFQTFYESYGLGAGVGSSRGSSFVSTVLATTGIPGIVCLAGLFGYTLRVAWKSRMTSGYPYFFGLLGALVGWAISIPDMAFPTPWFIVGAAIGMADNTRYVSETPINVTAMSPAVP